jgi:hypothetical protein
VLAFRFSSLFQVLYPNDERAKAAQDYTTENSVLRHHGAMKPHPETIEGPEAAARFDALARKVLSVPHEEIMRREAEYQRQSPMNPNRRGPKRREKRKRA